jgi:2-haloacid dehalogenase
MAEPAGRHIVVFDLGGVLIDWNPRHLYRKLFDDEAAMERFLATVCTSAWNLEQDAGEHPDQGDMIAAYFARWPEMMVGAMEATVAVLAELKALGVPLYALTNWSAETFPFARARFDFLNWFKAILVSGEVGLIKPDRRIFELLAQTHGFDLEHAVFIDDSPVNAGGATAAGLHGIHFTHPSAG